MEENLVVPSFFVATTYRFRQARNIYDCQSDFHQRAHAVQCVTFLICLVYRMQTDSCADWSIACGMISISKNMRLCTRRGIPAIKSSVLTHCCKLNSLTRMFIIVTRACDDSFRLSLYIQTTNRPIKPLATPNHAYINTMIDNFMHEYVKTLRGCAIAATCMLSGPIGQSLRHTQ